MYVDDVTYLKYHERYSTDLETTNATEQKVEPPLYMDTVSACNRDTVRVSRVRTKDVVSLVTTIKPTLPHLWIPSAISSRELNQLVSRWSKKKCISTKNAVCYQRHVFLSTDVSVVISSLFSIQLNMDSPC